MIYEQFLKSKVRLAGKSGFDVDDAEINPALKPHNKLMVKWLVNGGRRACFARFGLHKTVTQLETIRIILSKTGGRGLIVCPLNVRAEFIRDAKERLKWKTPPKFIRRIEEADETGIYITNYETIRDGKMDPRLFTVASLDEASILRGFGGSKTFREFMRLFTGDGGPLGNRKGTDRVNYRFVATATPSPNEYIELLAYADFLGIMDVSQAKTRFFKRDSTQADKLTLYPHKEEEFWLWVASWALFVQKPSDITGNIQDDAGYELEELTPTSSCVNWHEIKTDHSTAGMEKDGQHRMFKDNAVGLEGSAQEKRESLHDRIKKVYELRALYPNENKIIWHDLESERHTIEKAIPESVSVYGSQDLEDRENIIERFMAGEISDLNAKPTMLGSGCNLQRECGWSLYAGIGFKFNDFIQSLHRIYRYGMKANRFGENHIRIDLIYTEAERHIRKQLERKWNQHNELVKRMTEIIKKYGLNHVEMAQHLTRKMGIERVEVLGKNFKAVQTDNVPESKRLETNSIGLILTSWPFANQYEYSPNYADFGHTDNSKEFFDQMDFLTPELFRALIPGRIYALHVKDRIIPGGMNGLGFQTTYPFHLDCITHMIKHGFGYLGMKTIVTDVVRENNQTYRLGWTEQCKDGSKMGVGMPEYLLLFRKPQTDTTKAYSDIPVFKEKKEWSPSDKKWLNENGYSRAKWQVDAHGYARSNGNRLLAPEEWLNLEHDQIFQTFRKYTETCVYDFDYHVKVGETLEAAGKLPSGFMLLQPASWSEDVWTDITRMLTLNGSQWSLGKEMHICPFQLDLVGRVIVQMSNKGDIILDPFAGLFSVPKIAIELERYGVGFELNPTSFLDGVHYCKAAEVKMNVPTLFDTMEELKEVVNG
ncbi:MAG: DNA methyltransferase [Cyclobacteriaceae bacterium]